MANTTYQTSRSVLASSTPAERQEALEMFCLFLQHLDVFGVALVSIAIRQGKIEITLNNPIPADQLTHLGVILG